MTLPGEAPRPSLTLREAADACSLSMKQMRRHATAGRFLNATKDARGQWRIPVTDLIAAGFHLHASPPTEPVPERDELDELRAEVADLRRRAEVAEALARERAEALDYERSALRELVAVTLAAAEHPTPEPPSRPGPVEHRSGPAPEPAAPQPPPQPTGLIGGLWRRIVG